MPYCRISPVHREFWLGHSIQFEQTDSFLPRCARIIVDCCGIRFTDVIIIVVVIITNDFGWPLANIAQYLMQIRDNQ